MLLNELPDDALLLVFKNCSAQELTVLAQTCVRFAQLTQLDSLWKELCRKKYNVKDLGNMKSYYCLYSQLLYSFGWMLGMFQCQTTPHGGLLEVRYCDGLIQGIQWVAESISINDPLGKVSMFEIKEGNQHPQCLVWEDSCHRAEIRKIDCETFVYTCNNSDHESKSPRIITQKHKDVYKGITYKKLNFYCIKEIPLALQLSDGSPSPHIISPGLFIAEYSIHGIEIVLFKFHDTNEIHGVKVTGDSNVFSGEISVKFNIKYPIRPSLEEQRSIVTLRDVSPVETDITDQPVSEQIFVIPHDCYHVREDEVPGICKARYHGHGQIAETDFKNPRYSPVHVVIFNNDLIGVLWLNLQFFSVYHRKTINLYGV